MGVSRHSLVFLSVLLAIHFLLVSRAYSQTPITSSGLNTQVSAPAIVSGKTQYNITGGSRPGSGTNLFHSFGEFGVPTGNVANFINETGLSTTNILARVTGDNPTQIFDTIKFDTTIGPGGFSFNNTNLFLMNPRGIVVGAGAGLLNVGSVTFTTANYVGHTDGLRFNSQPGAQDALLSTAAVAAFGFLGSASPGTVTFNGAVFTHGSSTTPKNLSVIGGDITVSGSRPTLPRGQVNLVSVGVPVNGATGAEITLTSGVPNPPAAGAFNSLGRASIQDISRIDVTGTGGGKILIRAGQFIMSNSGSLRANTTSTLNGLGIEVYASTASMDFSTIQANTSGAGTAGTVRIEANEDISLANQASITGTASSTGNGGVIVLRAPEITVTNDSTISSNTTSTLSTAGAAGSLLLETDTLSLTSTGNILALTGGRGQGGQITVQGLSGTGSLAQDVSLTTSTISARSNSTATNAGRAGNITMNSSRITMSGVGGLTTSTIQAPGGSTTITAGTLMMSDGSNITATTTGAGQGGTSVINADTISLQSGAKVNTSSEASASGSGGSISIHAQGTLGITGAGSGLFSESKGSGSGGNLTLQANTIELSDTATISAKSTGSANAGTINITAGNTFESTNGSVTTESTVASGGDITLNASHLVHLVDSKVTTSVAGGPTTAGGNISIDPEFVVLQNSQILAQAFAGTGGNITITAGTFMVDPSSLVSASSQLGVSGTVDIRAPIQNLSGALVPLTQEFLASPQLLAQRCAARYADGQFSTFVVAAREGTPREPGGYLTSPPYTAGTETGMARTKRIAGPYIVSAIGLPGYQVKTSLGTGSDCLAGNILIH